jgi:coenzyme F420 hydrogenase subunit beta
MHGRYALVGIPCFIKATRLLAAADPIIAARIAMRVAIVCGHLKSARFADYLALRCEVAPDQAKAIDFRHKLSDRHAGDYAVAVTPTGSTPVVKRMAEIYGGNWGYGFFKYSACDFCDDVVGETADISVGDAWLPGYIDDGMGANIVVVRDPALVALIDQARGSGALTFDAIDPDMVAKSQDAGLRDRREGLAWRLAEKDGAGQWRPRKRVEPSRSMPQRRQRIYALRQRISVASHAAFAAATAANSLAVFDAALRPLTNAYDALYRPSAMAVAWRFPRRAARKFIRIVTGR